MAVGQVIGWAGSLRPALPALLAALPDWRLAFLLAAAPAPAMLLLVLTLPRVIARAAKASNGRATAGGAQTVSILAFVGANRATIGLFASAFAIATLGFAATASWSAVIATRLYGETPAQVGAALGLASLIATPIAFAQSVIVTRLFARRWGTALPLTMIAGLWGISALLEGALIFTSSARQVYLLAFAIYAVTTGASMYLPTALQQLAPAPLRARVIAAQGVLGLAVGAVAAPLVGALADAFFPSPRGLLQAAVLVAAPCLITAAGLLLLCRGPFVQTAREMAAETAG